MEQLEMLKIDRSLCSASAWSGGATTELLIGPEGATYAGRDFLWRLSSATVELEESTFTALPDYDRIIMTLEGEMDLSHNGGSWIHLKEFAPHSFDGADLTVSRGKVTDFNLMLKKGSCRGEVTVLEAGPGVVSDGTCCGESLFFYCHEGSLRVEEEVLGGGQALFIKRVLPTSRISYEAKPGSRAVLARIRVLSQKK